MVLFTGKIQNGRQVAAIAAERLIPSLLELSGKHPMIVAKDAPLARAAKAAVWGGLANCGQLSTSVERVYVEEPVYTAFSEAVSKEISHLRQGLDFSYRMDLGRLIVQARLEVLERHLEDARAQGARVIGGEILDRQRLLVSPALILDATPKMLVMQEETFGPVLALMSVRDLKEAFQLANQGPHGLSASLWTKNLAQGESLGLLLESGLVGINDLPNPAWVGSLPRGGFKDSGLGRRHCEEGLRMFCQAQSVVVHEWPMEAPDFWWFPYGWFKSRILAWLTRFI
jgi:betaine-aldehyde dehydrogenase